MLKWILGVHKKTTNNFCYGDTGRLPWAISVLPQCIKYFSRAAASKPDTNNVNYLLYHTFEEQRNLGLTWYSTWKSVTETGTCMYPSSVPTTAVMNHYNRSMFIEQWRADILQQPKMSFYRSIKGEFKEELYLSINSRAHRTNIAKIRSSSHDLRIGKGRYSNSTYNKSLRACRYCCDEDLLVGLEELPCFETPIQETEEHALTECPGYHHIRSQLSENLLSLLLLKEYSVIMSSPHLPEFGRYVTACYMSRNPKEKRTT